VHTGKEDASDNKKRLVLGCGALVYDLLRLIKQNPSFSDKVNLQCLPYHKVQSEAHRRGTLL